MSTQKSPFYTAMAVLFGIVVLAGGAAKLYRGVSNLSGSGLAPKVGALLKKSDASVAQADQQSTAIAPAFQELLADFDKLGLDAFRSEKRDSCEKLIEQFAAVSEHLNEASKSLVDATKHGADKNTNEFLVARSRSYKLFVKANNQNIDILRVTLDESIVDRNVLVEKILSLAQSRDADQQAAKELAAESDAILKRS